MDKQVERGWFELPGRPGDRKVEDQFKGLDWLWANCAGKTVLDAGCAEGLIAIECAKRGAKSVDGIEIMLNRTETGQRLRGDLPVYFKAADMNTWRPVQSYDIVLGLAILQKLRDPGAVAVMLANAAREAVVFRLPPAGAPTIVDRRSGNAPHRIGDLMAACGFTLKHQVDGHLNEWIGVWTR